MKRLVIAIDVSDAFNCDDAEATAGAAFDMCLQRRQDGTVALADLRLLGPFATWADSDKAGAL
jgi:hypothetical protein